MDQAEVYARALHAANPAPALSLAVAGRDGPLWQAAYGKVDLEFDVPAAPGHLFRLGSVSKVVTAVAAARLVSRGLVELDTPIAYWLPDLPEHHRATTLRQLLTHRGGVRHYTAGDLDANAPGGRITHRHYADRDEILALFIDDDLVAPPGERVSYSSFGYTLASVAMEAAAGQEFLALVAEQVAEPFGLASLCADEVAEVVPGRASGYFAAREIEMFLAHSGSGRKSGLRGDYARVTMSNPAFCWAGAGLLMAMPDLAKFGAAMLDGSHGPLTSDERELLFTPLTEATEGSPPLGLGWRVDDDARGRRRWHHAGTTPGGRASLVVYPGLGLSVALASNVMTAPADVLTPSAELADLFS